MGILCDERTELFPLSWCLLYPVNNMIMSNDKFMNLFYCVYTCFGLCFLFAFLALSFLFVSQQNEREIIKMRYVVSRCLLRKNCFS